MKKMRPGRLTTAALSLVAIASPPAFAQEGTGRLRAMDLSRPERWIMPASGMEILPSSTISSAVHDGCLPHRAHVIPSTDTGSICKYSSRNTTIFYVRHNFNK